MRFNKHVSITRDFTAMFDYSPVIATLHQQLLLNGIVPTPVPQGPYIETAAGIWWVPGYATGEHKLTTSVFHNHLTIAQDGHNLGMMLIHIAIPPNDLMIPMNMLKSSRKAMFKAGEVLADGDPIACCTMFDWGLIPTPMEACSKIPALHVGCGMSVLLNSVIVGMHPIDMLSGWASIAVDVLIDRLDLPDSMEPYTDFASSLVGPLIELAGQEWGGYRGDASVGIEIADGVELTVSRSGTEQRWSGELEVTREFGTFGDDVDGRVADLHGRVTVRQGAPGSGPEWEAAGGASVFSDGRYERSIDSDGRTSTMVQHPGLEPSLGGGVLGPPTSGGGIASSGENPADFGFWPGWGDLPSL